MDVCVCVCASVFHLSALVIIPIVNRRRVHYIELDSDHWHSSKEVGHYCPSSRFSLAESKHHRDGLPLLVLVDQSKWKLAKLDDDDDAQSFFFFLSLFL